MNKTLFIDVDCVASEEPQQVVHGSPISFRKGVFQFLSRIARELDYTMVLLKPEKMNVAFENDIIRFCSNEQISFKEILDRREALAKLKYVQDTVRVLVCNPSYAEAEFFDADIIYFNEEGNKDTSLRNWQEIYHSLLSEPRKAGVSRKTSETDISCAINLDGKGQNEISTGLGFFDHMLQQIARHGNIDLMIRVKGDLHIDEHHTIEDVGLALGSAFSEALGNKKGVERYGFLLPMDDCLAQVAIDFGGRPWLVWDAAFTREKIGDMPTEMFYHFFKSFSDTAKCNLNIKAEGSNEHHKIESIFKAFAKSIGMAIKKNNTNTIPSTKGSL